MKRISAVAMYSGLLLAAVLSVLVSLFPEQAVGIFTTEEAIIAEGVEYLNIIRFTFVFFAISQILWATLRMAAVVQVAFVMSAVTFIINCGLNYLLIFGNFGAPRLGVTGSGIATLAARIIECAAAIAYVLFWDKNLSVKIRGYRPSSIGRPIQASGLPNNSLLKNKAQPVIRLIGIKSFSLIRL